MRQFDPASVKPNYKRALYARPMLCNSCPTRPHANSHGNTNWVSHRLTSFITTTQSMIDIHGVCVAMDTLRDCAACSRFPACSTSSVSATPRLVHIMLYISSSRSLDKTFIRANSYTDRKCFQQPYSPVNIAIYWDHKSAYQYQRQTNTAT